MILSMNKTKFNSGILSVLLLLLSWQFIAMMIQRPELFPGVTDVIKQLYLFITDTRFYFALGHTLIRGIIGFIIAAIWAFLMAITALYRPFWKDFFHPLIVITRSIPVIAIVLIALLWFSPPQLPVFIAIFTALPILYQTILSALEHTDKKWIEMARVFRKRPAKRFFYIYAPAAQALIFSGMATAMGFGWRAVIIGEVLASPIHGIGTGMKKAQAFIDMQELLGWTIIAILIGFLFDILLKLMAKIDLKKEIRFIGSILFKDKTKNVEPYRKTFEIASLYKSYQDTSVLQDFNAEFVNDDIYLMKSISGSGKTTLLNIIAGLIKYDDGHISLQKSQNISYAFQDLRLLPWLSVEENIAFSLPSFPHISDEETEKINQLIEMLELTAHRSKLPDELSGGERQRVALARALIIPAHVLLLDEPLTGLGKDLRSKTIKTIESWTAQYRPIIIWATHENIEEYLTNHVPVKS